MKAELDPNALPIQGLLALAQVATRLQISRVTCWRLHAERGLRVVKIGRSIRVRPADLEAWLEKNSAINDAAEGETDT